MARTRTVGIARLAVGTAGYRFAGLPIAFLTAVVTSRYLLPSGRGAFALATLTIALVASLLRLGGAVTHMISRSDEAEARTTLVRACVLSLGVGVLGAFVLLPIQIAAVPHAPRIVALTPFLLPVMLLTDAMNGFLFGQGKIAVCNRIQFINGAVPLLAITILVVGANLGLAGAFAGWIIGQVAGAAAAAVACRHAFRAEWSSRRVETLWDHRARQMLWFAVRFGLVGAASILNYRIDLFLLRAFHGIHAVGLYSVAVPVAELGWLLSQSLTVAVTPTIINAGDPLEAAQLVAKASRVSLILAFASAAALAIGSVALIPVMFGEAYTKSTGPLLVLLPGIIAFAPGGVLASFFTYREGHVGLTGSFALLSALITCLAGLLLIPPFSLIGAATSCSIGYGASALIAMIVFGRRNSVRLGEFVPRWRDCRELRSFVTTALRGTR